MSLNIGRAIKKGSLTLFAITVGGYGMSVLQANGDTTIGFGCIVIAAVVLVAREALKAWEK